MQIGMLVRGPGDHSLSDFDAGSRAAKRRFRVKIAWPQTHAVSDNHRDSMALANGQSH